MFCSTECWDCEDRKCEHYIDKTKLYFENQRLKDQLQQKENIIKEVREYIKQNEFYLDYKTGACIKGVMPLLEILDKGE